MCLLLVVDVVVQVKGESKVFLENENFGKFSRVLSQ